jgi:hypothetical protein
VKKTVAPIPAYLFCSPLEQPLIMSESTPEHNIKKRFNMMIDFDPPKADRLMIDD